jgi:hypothetical protein
MSTVKTQRTQYGTSTNPNNNFVVDASQADGTLKISRGNAGGTTQEILTVPSDDGVRVVKYLVRNPKPTTSGTAVDFSPSDNTGIPAWARKITITFDEVSTAGTGDVAIQLGTTSGIMTTGYITQTAYLSHASNVAVAGVGTGIWQTGSGASTRISGVITLQIHTGNTWESGGGLARWNDAALQLSAGRGVMGSTVTSLRVAAIGTTFDFGSVALTIEG